MAKLHCRAKSWSSCLVTSVSSPGICSRWHLHSPCTLADRVPSVLAAAGPALSSLTGVQSSQRRGSGLWVCPGGGSSSSTARTFAARTDKAMLNHALPTAFCKTWGCCKTPQLRAQMPPLPFFKTFPAWRRVLQSICEPWLGLSTSGSRAGTLPLVLGHLACVEGARGGDSGGRCFQTP